MKYLQYTIYALVCVLCAVFGYYLGGVLHYVLG